MIFTRNGSRLLRLLPGLLLALLLCLGDADRLELHDRGE